VLITSALPFVATITGLGKTVLLLVAGTFILWSLITAISIPKRNPRFPENLPMYLTITALLFLGQMGAVVWVTGTQEVEHVAHETGAGAEEPAPEQPAGEQPAGGGAEGDAAAGKDVFASAGCGSCHTLADAGASGTVGPNLDDAKPPVELVVDRVTNGQGVMPSFKGQLDEKQIADVAAYVASAAGS
jgi:mono/diheme cytochrome c family protein